MCTVFIGRIILNTVDNIIDSEDAKSNLIIIIRCGAVDIVKCVTAETV
jgi:hypothetical protein